MASYRIEKFFNANNFNRLERLLQSEGVPLPYAANASIARKVERIKQYFEGIGYDKSREYYLRNNAIDMLREDIQAHKGTDNADVTEYPDRHNHEETPISYEADLDDIFDMQTQYEALTESLWNELPQLKPETKAFKPQSSDDELNRFLQDNKPNHKFRSHDNAIWCNVPVDEEKFQEIFDEHKHRYTDNNETENDTYKEYYLNSFASYEDIFKYVDYIYETEKINGAFKIQFTFGHIVEYDDERYEFKQPTSVDSEHRIPVTIKDNDSLKKFKAYIISFMINDVQEHNRRVSLGKLICYFRVMFKVYRLSKTGAKLPGLEIFIKRKDVKVYTEDDNMCMFASYAFFRNAKIDNAKKAFEHARKYFAEFYNISTERKYAHVKEAIANYQGFNIATEIDDFCNHFKVNVAIYHYNDNKRYHLAAEYIADESYDKFNILLVAVGNKSHVMWVKNVESLTGLLFCPKCKQLICRKDSAHGERTMKRHINKCDGSPVHAKELKLDNISLPYCPHILKNLQYAYCLANNLPYEPIKYYITYDFETMEKPLNVSTNKTVINSQLVPISVASTFHTKAGNKTVTFDIRDGENFITQWIQALFDNALTVAQDNFDVEIRERKETKKSYTVSVIGYNSANFDTNLFVEYLQSDNWQIKALLGSASKFKQVIVHREYENYNINLRFIDAMAFVAGGPLKQFIKDFGSEGCIEKGIFPYEAINTENYNEVLSKSEPFEQADFHSELNQSDISDTDYQAYLEDARNFPTRWDYLLHYNRLDVEAMISPINNLIELFWEHKIDMLKSLSLSANASAIKYAKCYDDFDINGDYTTEIPRKDRFKITQEWFAKKCESYRVQDEKAKRDTSKNLKGCRDDYIDMVNLYGEQDCKCYICNEAFTWNNKPTLDRIDNSIGHTADNVKWCCCRCNKLKSDGDEKMTRLRIQLTKYAQKNHLPMTISSKHEDAYHILRNGIKGGLSIAMNRVNIKGESTVKHLRWNDEYKMVKAYSTDYIITHVCGVDFNSLYPSSYSSEPNKNNPYTNHIMYMPGSITGYFLCDNEKKKKRALRTIHSKDRFTKDGQLFVATVKGHIDEKYLNDFINFAPIFRSLEVTTNKDTIGEYMYNYMVSNHIPTDKQEKKLTMLLSTHDQYMSFSSYYLWFLIDTCHFIIDDVQSIILFDKHTGFNKFVKEFTKGRISNIGISKGRELFYKTCLNGSYGYDGKNTEKYTKTTIKKKNDTYLAQIYTNFVDTRKINDDCFAVTFNPRNYKCDTCIQEAFFTLDNAKFWYLNFIYNFMYKCLDMDRIHYVEGDTDSMYWAIAGNPNADYHQRFNYVIRDQEFYNEHVYEWFPDPSKDVYDEKKILGLAIEKEGENCIALAPKCYTIWNNDGTTKSLKLKGVSLKKNRIVSADYKTALESTVQGKNINLQLKNHTMSKVTVVKNALTATHTKVIVLPNQVCAPFIHGIKADAYKVTDEWWEWNMNDRIENFNDIAEDDYEDYEDDESYSMSRAEFEAAQMAAIDEEGY